MEGVQLRHPPAIEKHGITTNGVRRATGTRLTLKKTFTSNNQEPCGIARSVRNSTGKAATQAVTCLHNNTYMKHKVTGRDKVAEVIRLTTMDIRHRKRATPALA